MVLSEQEWLALSAPFTARELALATTTLNEEEDL